jgi:peptide/nickel transport system substrate-binding protein
VNQQIVMNLFDRLTSLAPDMTVRPGLATDWTVSPDGLRWTFRLRRGVQFHDGQPVDAEAVKFTFDRILDEKKPVSKRGQFAPFIKSVRVVDEAAIEMTLHQPFGPLPSLLATSPASIVSPKAAREFGDDFGRRPVGSGPFVLQERASGQRIVVVRNDRYWGIPAKPQQVIFRPVPEESTRVALLETGEVDIAQLLPPSQMKRLGANPQIQPLLVEGLEVRTAKLNVLHERFKDVRVRQAMNYAVNVPEIIDTILDGLGSFTGGPMPRLIPGAIGKYHYDPALAKKLLAGAGYPNGFKTSLVVSKSVTAGLQESQEALQAQWRAVGIDVTLNILERAGADQIRDLPPENSEAKQILAGSLTPGYPDPHAVLFDLYHSAQWSPGGRNSGFYKNARVDELFELGVRETDSTKRAVIYRELQEIIIEDAPVVFLETTHYGYAARRNLKDVHVSPIQALPFSEVSKN